MLDHRRDRAFTVNIGEPGGGDRLFYDEAMGMNFRTGRAGLPEIFAGIDANEGKRDAPAIYLSSIDVNDYFDGLHEANHVDLGERQPIESIWIGTRTRIAAHNDFPNNLACCAVGPPPLHLVPARPVRAICTSGRSTSRRRAGRSAWSTCAIPTSRRSRASAMR